MYMSDVQSQSTSYGEGFVRELNPNNEKIDWAFSWNGDTDKVMIVEGKVKANSLDGVIIMKLNGSNDNYWGAEVTDDCTVSEYRWGAGSWYTVGGLYGCKVAATFTGGNAFHAICFMAGRGTGYRGLLSRNVVYPSTGSVRSYMTSFGRAVYGPITSVTLQSTSNITGNISVYKRVV